MAEDKRLKQPLSAAEIEELRELEAKATPGPWAFSPYGDENRYGVGVVMDGQDNAVEGFDDSGDGIVVESVAPEVEGHANARLIASMRNALPRLLAMLTPPAEKAGSKGLVDGIKAISDEFGHNFTWMSREQMTPIHQPPSDAAVREAVERLESLDTLRVVPWIAERFDVLIRDIHTLLSHIRAAKSPRLTGEQVNALQYVARYLLVEGDSDNGNVHGPEAMMLVDAFGEAFPDGWFDMSSLCAKPNAMTGERLEALKRFRDSATSLFDSATKKARMLAELESTFPELGGG